MKKKIRILINTIPLLGEETGVGVYARAVAQALLQERELFETKFFHGVFSSALPEADRSLRDSFFVLLKEIIKKNAFLRKVGKKTLGVIRSLHSRLTKKTFDCYFEPNFILLPEIEARVKIVTVHDFSCFRYPMWHPKERVEYMERNFGKTVENADHIITVSQAMRKEAEDVFGIDPKRITAIPNGYDPSLFHPLSQSDCLPVLSEYALAAPYILFVGSVEPRKNLSTLLDAYSMLPFAVKEEYPLIIAGGDGWENADIRKKIERERRFVRVLGYVPRTNLAPLYAQATIFCYPSWYEGFGLPILEAMACGCPVLTSTHEALRETGGDAAEFVEANDCDALAQKIATLIEDDGRRKDLSQRGLARSTEFSWEKSTHTHINLIRSVCQKVFD